MQNTIKLKLAQNEPVLGIWSVIPCPTTVELIGLTGLDFTILDMEHGAFDNQTLANCIRAAELANTAPLVRVPGESFAAVQWALDLGAHGIVFPQVTDTESAKNKVASTKFAPEGHRGFNPFTRFTKYDARAERGVGKLDDAFGLNVIIVETAAAIKDIDAILLIPNLDVIYVGIYDLSFALGYNGDTSNPDLIREVEHLTKKILLAGKHVGLMVRNQQDIENSIEQGVRFLVYSVDTSLIRNAAITVVGEFNQARIKGKQQ